jgi:hypothetical protein
MKEICPQRCPHHEDLMKRFGIRPEPLVSIQKLALVFEKDSASEIGLIGMNGYFSSAGLKILDQAAKPK